MEPGTIMHRCRGWKKMLMVCLEHWKCLGHCCIAFALHWNALFFNVHPWGYNRKCISKLFMLIYSLIFSQTFLKMYVWLEGCTVSPISQPRAIPGKLVHLKHEQHQIAMHDASNDCSRIWVSIVQTFWPWLRLITGTAVWNLKYAN